MVSMKDRADRFADNLCKDCNRKLKLEVSNCKRECKYYWKNVSLYMDISSEQEDIDKIKYNNANI